MPRVLLAPALALAVVGCDGGTPSPAPDPSSVLPGATVPLAATPQGSTPATVGANVLLWLDPDFAPDTSPRLQAILDGWRDAHPDARLEIAIRPARGATSASAFMDALAGVAPTRLPDVALVPLDAVAALHERGLAADLGSGPMADRASEAFPFAARLAGTADGIALAVPIAADVAHLIGRGPAVATWDGLSPADTLVVPVPETSPAALAITLAAYAAADGPLDALAEPDGAALTVAFGALEAARARGAMRVAAAPLPLGPLREAAGARAAQVTAGGYVAFAASDAANAERPSLPGLDTAVWSPLPGLDGAAPPVAWGWGLITPPGDVAKRELVLDLVERISRPEDTVWSLEAGHLPAYPLALDAAFANPALPAAAEAYGEFLSVQLMAASAIALPEADWERWKAAVAALYQGQGATASVGALVPER